MGDVIIYPTDPSSSGLRSTGDISATDGQTIFDTTSYFDIVGDPNVFLNGVMQPETSYSVAGNIVTFVFGLQEGDIVVITN